MPRTLPTDGPIDLVRNTRTADITEHWMRAGVVLCGTPIGLPPTRRRALGGVGWAKDARNDPSESGGSDRRGEDPPARRGPGNGGRAG